MQIIFPIQKPKMFLGVCIFVGLLFIVNGHFVLPNGCFIGESVLGIGYACDGKNSIISCFNNITMPDDFKLNCANTPEAGGSATNTWCYPNSEENICGPPPGICSSPGIFAVTIPIVDKCKYYYSCTFLPANNTYNQILYGCAPGQNFSIIAGTCHEGPCITSMPPVCTLSQKKADPRSCRHYFECAVPNQMNAVWNRKMCPFLQAFDSKELKCKFTWNVICGDRPRFLF